MQTFWGIYIPYKYPNILYPVILHTYPPMKMEQTECSNTPAYKIQTLGNYPDENIQQSSKDVENTAINIMYPRRCH